MRSFNAHKWLGSWTFFILHIHAYPLDLYTDTPTYVFILALHACSELLVVDVLWSSISWKVPTILKIILNSNRPHGSPAIIAESITYGFAWTCLDSSKWEITKYNPSWKCNPKCYTTVGWASIRPFPTHKTEGPQLHTYWLLHNVRIIFVPISMRFPRFPEDFLQHLCMRLLDRRPEHRPSAVEVLQIPEIHQVHLQLIEEQEIGRWRR